MSEVSLLASPSSTEERADPIAVARSLAQSFKASARERDKKGGTAKAERDAIRESGLLSLLIPQTYGGWGADWPTALEVVKEIAKADGSIAHVFGYHLGSVPIVELFGTLEQKERFYRNVVKHRWFAGNASSENNAHVMDWKVSATPTDDGGYIFNGTKHFCSGSKDSDRLFIFGVILEEGPNQGAIVSAVIPTNREGVTVNDDWDAMGMRQTDSGSTRFDHVRVAPEEVLGPPNAFIEAFLTSGPGSLWTPTVQLTFSTMYLGVALGALETAKDYTRTQSRPWTPAGVASAVEDPYTLAAYGDMVIALQGAEAAQREAARTLQQTWEKRKTLTPEDRGELMIKVSVVKALATKVSLDVTSRVFEVMGARASHSRYGFDRFWRDVRTHTLHDPVSYHVKAVGNWALNGAYPIPGFTS